MALGHQSTTVLHTNRMTLHGVYHKHKHLWSKGLWDVCGQGREQTDTLVCCTPKEHPETTEQKYKTKLKRKTDSKQTNKQEELSLICHILNVPEVLF